MTAPDLIRAIDGMVQRPSMYFGERNGYLREVCAFACGADFGSAAMKRNESLLPDAFVKLVCSRLSDSDGQHPAWQSRIERATTDDSAAWLLFVDLWQEYRKSAQVSEGR